MRAPLASGLLVGLLLCGGCAGPGAPDPPERMLLDAPVVRIPIREERDNLYTLEVYLEGAGPFRFVLDSGAGMTVLDPSVAERFLIEDQSLPFRIRGALGGEPRAVSRGAIGELSFQPPDGPGARVHEVPFLAQTVPLGFDGVAGLGLFRGCRVVFDFPSRFVEASRPEKPVEDIPVADGRPPTVVLSLEGAPVEAVVDTGFSGILYLPPKDAEGLKTLGAPVRVAILVDVHGSRPAEERRLGSELRVGSGSVMDPWILVGGGGALLGNGFLRDYRVVFDGRGRFVDVEAPR